MVDAKQQGREISQVKWSEVMKRKTILAAALSIALGGVSAAYAHGGASGVVKDRMELMEVLGDSMKELTAIMSGKQDYDTGRVRTLAGKIGGHGGDAMTKLFPEGSLDHPSEALPAIWADWARFSAIANQLSDYASGLALAAGNDRSVGTNQGGMTGGGMMGGGMMGGGMMGGGMMGAGRGPTPEMLARMPPDAAFLHLADTCSACHQDFRKKKN